MLKIIPISLREANAFVAEHHRHNQPTVGHKFSVAVADDGRLCGVAICGLPIARGFNDGKTIEIRRVCTDGTKNACSILYGAASRAAHAMGYTHIVTYTLQSEPETSLKAAGFKNTSDVRGGSWDTPSRPREDTIHTESGALMKYPQEKKFRWEKRYKE